MKKLLSILLVGVLLMGIGSAVCVFEFSDYTYGNDPKSILPYSTTTLTVRTPNDSGTIYLDSYNYNINEQVSVAVDDSLSDQTLRLDIYGPSDILRYHVSPTDNSLRLYDEVDPFKALSVILDCMKHKQFFNLNGDYTVTVYASTETAKRLVIGADPALAERRNQMVQLQEDYEENISELSRGYEEQLNNVRSNYEEQLKIQRESYEERLKIQQDDYEEQLLNQQENYEEQIQSLTEAKN